VSFAPIDGLRRLAFETGLVVALIVLARCVDRFHSDGIVNGHTYHQAIVRRQLQQFLNPQ
jgi:hypothetical protein